MCVEESNLDKERNKSVYNSLILVRSWQDHRGHEDTDRLVGQELA